MPTMPPLLESRATIVRWRSPSTAAARKAFGSRSRETRISPCMGLSRNSRRSSGSSSGTASSTIIPPALKKERSIGAQQGPRPALRPQREVVAPVDVGAMEMIDQEEVAEHEEVRPVHRIDRPAQDARPRVEGPPRLDAPALHVLGRHPRRTEGDLVVAVALVEPPGVVEEHPRSLQATVELGAGERRQVIEGGDVEAVLAGELDRALKVRRRVVVVAEDERAVEADVVPAQVLQGFSVAAAHGV